MLQFTMKIYVRPFFLNQLMCACVHMYLCIHLPIQNGAIVHIHVNATNMGAS